MIIPSKRSIWIQASLALSGLVAAPLTFGTPLFSIIVLAALVAEGAFLGLILLDGVFLPGPKSLVASRSIQGRFQENRTVSIELKFDPIDARGKRRLHYSIYDDTGPYFRVADFPLQCTGRAPYAVSYRATGMRRGIFSFSEVYVTVQSVPGLALRRFRLPCKDDVSVHSELPPVNGEFIAAQKRIHSVSGWQRRAAPGGEREFYRMRDYQPGDEPRRIDWKASARSGKLITREYEKEQKQTLFLVVDMSRWMALRSGQRSLLDEALSAALMLAGVASSRGDSVGLLAYGSEPHLFYPPARRETAALSAAVCALMPEDRSLHLDGLASFLGGALRNETILVLFTSVPHEDGIEDWVRFSKKLSGSHRPLLVLLENDETMEILKESPLEEVRRLSRRNNLFPLPDIPDLTADRVGAQQLATFHYLKEKERRLRFIAGPRAGIVTATRKGLNLSVLSEYLKIRFASTF